MNTCYNRSGIRRTIDMMNESRDIIQMKSRNQPLHTTPNEWDLAETALRNAVETCNHALDKSFPKVV